MIFKDPATYVDEFVCIRCGSGWPCCADKRPDGTYYTHEESCALYRFRANGYDACPECQEAIEQEMQSDQ